MQIIRLGFGGYRFIFRNYRADVAKWLSQDLIGSPTTGRILIFAKTLINDMQFYIELVCTNSKYFNR